MFLNFNVYYTCVHDGQRLVGLVWSDLDVQLLASLEFLRLSQGLVADLVQSIRRVGDQLTQKDFLVAVKSVDDQAHQLGNFSLEGERFIFGVVSHCVAEKQ